MASGLMLENIALRHQLEVLERSVARPKIQDSDRMFWILIERMLAEWKEAVHFVKPATVRTPDPSQRWGRSSATTWT